MGHEMSWDLGTRKSFGISRHEVPPLRARIARAIAGIPAKTLARVAGSTPKAAERWKAGDNTPNAEKLLRLCAVFDEVWAEVRSEACRTEDDAEQVLAEFAAKLSERRRVK